MTTYLTMEAAALDIVTALIMFVYQMVLAIVWLLFHTVRLVLSAALENAGIIIKLVGIVAVTFVAVTNPALTIGLLIVAAYAKYGRKLHRI
jgi:hypothetical protein